MNFAMNGSASWPEQDMEAVLTCPACNGPHSELLHDDMRDDCFGAAAGIWQLVRCIACGSAYLAPRPTPQSIGRAYAKYYTHVKPIPKQRGVIRRGVQAIADSYLARKYGMPRNSMVFGTMLAALLWPLRGFLDGMMRHLPSPAPGRARLLDVGCGHGAYLKLAAEANWSVRGVDFDVEAVSAARSQGLDVMCGAIQSLPLTDPAYDYITLSHVIEHVHDPAALLREIFLRLTPGGHVWIETPNIEALGHKRFGRHWRGLEVPRHLVLFTESALHDLLHRTGFTRIEPLYRGPAAPMTYAESEAIAAGLPLGSVVLGAKGAWGLLRDCALQECLPSRREFITLRAMRPI